MSISQRKLFSLLVIDQSHTNNVTFLAESQDGNDTPPGKIKSGAKLPKV